MNTEPASLYPTVGILPKVETQASEYLKQHPEYDGRNVIVAIFDTGVDPGAAGLQVTSDGKPKILDIVDCSGSGDCDMSAVVSLNEDGTLSGLSGRKLMVNKQWDNPEGKFRIGLKFGYDLYPADLKNRVKSKREETYNERQRELKTEIQRKLAEATGSAKKELETQIEVLEGTSYKDVSPIHDVVMWKTSQGIWNVVVDTNEDGNLAEAKVLCDFKVDRSWDTFPESKMNYSVKVYSNGNIVSIVTNAGSHGTHVAGIVGAHFPETPELNGVAPGVQLVSVKIGDSRLGSMETGTSLVRGLIAAKENNVDLINMSYGEPTTVPDAGRFTTLLKEFIEKYNITFVSSAGNNGPGLSTVGAPGSTTTGAIGVGAMVTPDMMEVAYSLRETPEAMQFTWSSRGPVPDGSLGVSISAPGGAIAPIPNWTLSKSQLMNGTSMSSPNCCGCLSLVVSGLKANNKKYSPFFLKRAMENTASFDPSRDTHTQGYGMVQVVNTFEYCMKFSDEDYHVRYSVLTAAGNKPGFYAREAHEMAASEFTVNVAPQFLPSVTDSEKIKFEKRIKITSSADWVKVPSNVHLLNDDRPFKILVDPSELLPSLPYYAEVQGWDSACIEKGPIFRFPVTVVKPLELPEKEHTLTWKDLTFTPGQIYRYFVTVPDTATWAKVTVKTNGVSPKRLFAYQHAQILPQQSIKWTMWDKYVWMGSESKNSFNLNVSPGHTLEVNFAQYWSSLGTSGTAEVTISFHGVQVNTYGTPLVLTTGTNIHTEVRSALRQQTLKPQAYLTTLRKILFPTSSVVTPLYADRDLLPGGRQINQLVNTYVYQAQEACDIIPRLPSISDVLYESPYESQFWMIFNETNELVGSGDYVPTQVKLPKKGKYTIKVQFRDDKGSTLNGLKNQVLYLERCLAKDKQPSLPLYSSLSNAITGGGKAPSNPTLAKGQSQIFVIGCPDASKIPKEAKPGDTLFGYVSWREYKGDEFPYAVPNDGLKTPVGGNLLTFHVTGKITPPPAPASTFSVDEKKTVQENFENSKRQSALDYLLFLVNKGKLNHVVELIPPFLERFSGDIEFLKLNVKLRSKLLANAENEENLVGVIESTDLLFKSVDCQALALFFGTLHEDSDPALKEHNEKKEALVNALYEKALALLKLDKLKPAEATKKEFQETLKELSKWVKVAEESKYLNLHMQNELLKGNVGTTLKALNKALSSTPDKELYMMQLDLLTQLGWSHAVANRKAFLTVSFPPSQRLF